MMKVLILTSTFPRWHGDEEPPFVYELSKRLATTHSVDVLAPHAKGAALHEEMDGLSVYRFRYAPECLQTLAYEGGIMSRLKQNKLRALLIPLFLLFQLITIIKLIRKNNYDIIHAHWVVPQGFLASIVKTFTHGDGKLVITAHGGDIYGLKPLRKIKQWTLAKANLTCFVSKTLLKDTVSALNLSENFKSAIAPMGVDAINVFTPGKTKRANDLIFVGRFTEKKGLPVLLESLALLRKRGYTPSLTVIGGEKEALAQMQELVKQLNIVDQCRFLGRISNRDIPKQLRDHKIFIFPSLVAENGDAEGLGLTAIEAMACECLLIASDLSTSREFVIDDTTGLIFRSKDSLHLSEKIQQALKNRESAEKIARAGRQLVLENYDWSKVTKSYVKFYSELHRD